MAFNGNFSTSQTSDATSFVLTDTSTGTDSNIVSRTIYLYKTDGTLLTGAAIDWPVVSVTGDTKTLSGVLTKDYSLNIVVTWTSSSPLSSPSTYTKTVITTFTGNLNEFLYSLIQRISATRNLVNDNNFYKSLSALYTEIDNAVQATNYSNQFSAQAALDRGYALQQNQNLFF